MRVYPMRAMLVWQYCQLEIFSHQEKLSGIKRFFSSTERINFQSWWRDYHPHHSSSSRLFQSSIDCHTHFRFLPLVSVSIFMNITGTHYQAPALLPSVTVAFIIFQWAQILGVHWSFINHGTSFPTRRTN